MISHLVTLLGGAAQGLFMAMAMFHNFEKLGYKPLQLWILWGHDGI